MNEHTLEIRNPYLYLKHELFPETERNEAKHRETCLIKKRKRKKKRKS